MLPEVGIGDWLILGSSQCHPLKLFWIRVSLAAVSSAGAHLNDHVRELATLCISTARCRSLEAAPVICQLAIIVSSAFKPSRGCAVGKSSYCHL